MVLIMLAALLVLGIAFYQAVQGLFSALIMTVLTILCAAVAFEFYEPLAQLLYARQPAHADAISLIALFVIPLLALRLVLDKLVPGNVLVGAWPDRIAGGALGLITGMIAAGVLTIAIQMLPTGPRWLTYRPFNDALQREQALAPFYPDEFTLGLVDTLSAGAFQDERRFSDVHDNLLLEAWCARNESNQVRPVENEPVVERAGRMDAPPDSLKLIGCYEPNAPPFDPNRVPSDPLMGDSFGKILILRVGVKETARDKDNWWRLPATHFRLAVRKDKASAALVSHYPVAYLTYVDSNKDWGGNIIRGTTGSWQVTAAPVERENNVTLTQVGRLVVQRPWKPEGGPEWLVIDWVFRIGREEVPEFLAFRRVARPSFPVTKPGMPTDPQAGLDRAFRK